MFKKDRDFIQLDNAQKLAAYINLIDGPSDLSDEILMQTRNGNQWIEGEADIYDEDGDGIEDNRHLTFRELDEYYNPAVYGVVEDLHNTHNDKLPGHDQKEFDDMITEPVDTYTIIQDPNWKRL